MAVEAGNPNLFQTAVEASYGLPRLSAMGLMPMFNNVPAPAADCFPARGMVKDGSGLTYAHRLPVSRKRPREPMSRVQNGNRCGSVTFLGEDVSLLIQQQQLEMDRLISQHNNEVRSEIEERRKRYWRSLITVVEDRVMKRLKAKDDEIEKITKLNFALQEKVKSLSVEGQIWRDLARTNEVAAHTLRANLEQVLAAQPKNNEQPGASMVAPADDEQSCCGSNCHEDEDKFLTHRLDGMCRHCGMGESSVLLLPCRHLCLCTVCGSSIQTCPVCKTPKNTSLQVIMSDL